MLGLLAVGLLAVAGGLVLHAAGALRWLERPSVDARFSLRGRQPPPSNLVVVGLDNDSLGQLPHYPFSRQIHARVLENLHAAGARLIVYDISFDRETTPGADEALFEAARRASPVVFATSLISPSGATQVLGGNTNLASIGDRAAAADLVPDPDGVLRHTLDQVNGLPTIAAATSRMLTGRPADVRQLRGGWIDFPGPPGTVGHLSFVRVSRNHFDPALVRGKVVVVGATASVHRDVKPANVLLTLDESEHAYLTDFGVAKRVGALNHVTRAGQWVGTLDYLAPEQIRGEDVDASADIYALAGLLYSCLCGQTPYPRENEVATMLAHLSAPAPAVSSLRPDLPAQLDAVIARGMAKDPAERYESAGALARACAEALGIAVDGGARLVAEQGPGERGPLLGDTAPTMLSD